MSDTISIRILALLLLAVLLVGCGPITTTGKDAVNPNLQMTIIEDAKSYRIYVHKETGCHYIKTSGANSGFTIMVNTEGKPYCPLTTDY